MTNDTAAWDKALLIALPLGEAFVLSLLLAKKIWRTLPVFVVYLAWGLLSDIVLYYILTWMPDAYQRFYTIETIVDSTFLFIVLVELFWSVLRPVRSTLPRGTIYVLTGLIAVAALIIWPLASKTVPPKMDAQSLLIFHLSETFAILRVLCFVVIAGFSQLLAIGWRDRELQVVTGLGVYAIASLLAMLLHASQPNAGGDAYHNLDIAVSLSYLGTLTYWVFSFVTKEQERKEFSPQMQQLLVLMGGGARAGRIALTDLPPDRPRKKD